MVPKEIVSQVGLFEGIPESQLEKIAEIGQVLSFTPGEQIFVEGHKADRLYVLLEGKVIIRVHLTSRPDAVTVAVINRPNDTFGWSAIVAPYHYTASAISEEQSRTLAIPGLGLLEVLKDDPISGIVVMRRVAEVIGSRLRNSRSALLKSL